MRGKGGTGVVVGLRCHVLDKVIEPERGGGVWVPNASLLTSWLDTGPLFTSRSLLIK